MISCDKHLNSNLIPVQIRSSVLHRHLLVLCKNALKYLKLLRNLLLVILLRYLNNRLSLCPD